MKLPRGLTTVFLMAVFGLSASIAEGEPAKIVLMAGQSNMQGCGRVSELPPNLRTPRTGVLTWVGSKWVPVQPGFGANKGIQFGPEITLGPALLKAWPDGDIRLIKVAMSGHDLAVRWLAGKGPSCLAFQRTVAAALTNLKSTGKDYEIGGMLWLATTSLCAGAGTVRVPSSISTGLDADVTEALNAFLGSVPDGATVAFPERAVYRIEGTLLLENRVGITIDGRGTTFRATDPMPDCEKTKDYAGWRRGRTRSQWRVKRCRSIVLRNMRVIGAHKRGGRKGEYDYNREAQHAFDLLGVTNVLLEAVHVSDVYGDGVYISAGSRGVTVRKSRIERTGRQGMAVGKAFGVLIERNDILDSRRGLLDIEPYGKAWACGDIRVIGNRFGDSRLLALPMGGSGAIGPVLVANNTFSGPNGTPLVIHRTKTEGVKRGPFFFVGNSAKVGGSPAPGLRFGGVSGVLVAGNRLGFSEKRKMSVLSTTLGPVGVFGNRFPGAARLAEDAVKPLLMQCANVFEEGSAIPAEIELLEGGYAVRLKLNRDLECVGVMRSEGTTGPVLEAFGLKTRAQWVWELREKGRVVEKAEG